MGCREDLAGWLWEPRLAMEAVNPLWLQGEKEAVNMARPCKAICDSAAGDNWNHLSGARRRLLSCYRTSSLLCPEVFFWLGVSLPLRPRD